jgi:hypothetical protein
MAFTASTVWEVQTGGLDDFQTVSSVVAGAGSGYTNGDILTLSGGTSTTAATFTAIVAGGVLTGVTPLNTGHYTVLPANPVSVTGGTGTTATLTVTWNAGGNGGGFDAGVAGFPTDGAISSANTASPVLSSASYNFVTGDATAGAWAYLKAGTGVIAGWYKIVSCAGNAATLDAAIGHVVLATGALNTVAGCSASASLTSITWGCDYSQSATPILSFTDLVIDGTTDTKFTSAAHPVGKNFIGNIINVTGGTNVTVQRVAVVSTVTTTATCDKSLGTLSSTGGIASMAGCLKSVGAAGALTTSNGQSVWVKSGSYSITSATANIPGGCYVPSSNRYFIGGYQTLRWDFGTAPVLTASGISTATLVNNSSSSSSLTVNLSVDGASLTAINGITSGNIYRCKASNCSNVGIDAVGFSILCSATGCSGTAPALRLRGGSIACEAYSNATTGAGIDSYGSTALYCVSFLNSGPGFTSGSSPSHHVGCVAYGNGGNGFINPNNANGSFVNCIAESNLAAAFSNGQSGTQIINCATFNNTSGSGLTPGFTSGSLTAGNIAYLATAFVNAAAGNFALNNNNPGGAQLRAAGIPRVFPDGLTTGYLDIGAAQHADPTISYPAASKVYAGTDRGDGVTGTLHASNISTAAGSGSNLSAGILATGNTVDDVVGSLAGGGAQLIGGGKLS